MRSTKRIALALGVLLSIAASSVLFGNLPLTTSRGADPQGEAKAVRPLRISLFPYVPDQKLIQSVIEKRWKKLHPDVPLDFVTEGFDSYDQDPPADLDVFEFDGIGLDYYVRNNFLSPLALEDAKDSEDYLDFAWKGCLIDGRLYAIPRLACTYVMIYREGDKEIEGAKGLRELSQVLGVGPSKYPKGMTEPVPEPNKGLLIDLSGGTDCACLYLDAFADVTGKYSVRPKLPLAIDLDSAGLADLRLLAGMAGKPQAFFEETWGAPPKRPTWFGEGKGRAFAGYTERLYFIPQEAHGKLKVRDLPMGERNKVNHLYVDMLGLNSSLRGERRKLAIELINVCTEAETMLECLMPADGKPSQYLLPVRASVLKNEKLLKEAPLYAELAKLLDPSTNPRTYRLGPEYRDWLKLNKKVIQSQLFE
jgi:thiamine pyridinylase